MCTVSASTRKSLWLCSSYYLCRSWRAKKRQEKKNPSQRSTLLMKHCREAGPVALSKPRSALWTHTPTVHPPPHRHTREKTPKVRRVSLETARWWERECERRRKLLTSTSPHIHFESPPSPPTSHPTEKSKLHLLTAFMIAQHADEWKLPQVLSGGRQQARPCVYSRNRSWWPYAPESERNIRLVSHS